MAYNVSIRFKLIIDVKDKGINKTYLTVLGFSKC